MKERVVLSWSGGKDSTLMLDRMLRNERYDVAALVTTMDESSQRISAHGVPIDLIAQQAASIGLPMLTVALPKTPSNAVYLSRFEQTLLSMKASGVESIAFGDIFLEDLRHWREQSFSDMGFTSLFPLWGERSQTLAGEFIDRGFGAVICCVNGAHLDKSYLGRQHDGSLLEALPPQVDCCGENGEFHSFTYDGPIFREPVHYAIGETTYQPSTHSSPVSGHWFCDLRSVETMPAP
jgi:uncharacterized protein (TIGR00290 family)